MRVDRMTGIAREELNRLRVDFPSITPVANFSTQELVEMFMVEIPDSRQRTPAKRYRCVVDLRGSTFLTHVLNPPPQKHPHVYTSSILPGTKQPTKLVCQGPVNGITDTIRNTLGKIGAYLNHIITVLNT